MKYIFANWKMYLTVDQSVVLAKEIAKQSLPSDYELALFPTALAFTKVLEAVNGSGIKLGAQNCNWTPRGAYTGAVSADLFAEAGAAYALVGHSERRHVFGEGDTEVRKKIEAALAAGLIPVVCVGETKEEKDNGRREYRLKKQLMKAFEQLDLGGKKIMIAYEPVWAIGTGDACLPADADDVHGFIKQEIKQYTSADVSVLYGGSVDSANIASYLSQATVDGVLVGSASSDLASFSALLAGMKSA